MSKNKKLIILGIAIVLLSIIGFSYAYWSITVYQEDENIVISDCFMIEFTEKNPISLTNAYPITEDVALSTITPYEFTITNTCDAEASYQVNLESLVQADGVKRLSDEYVAVNIGGKTVELTEEVTPILTDADKAYKLVSGYLESKEVITYQVYLWMDYDTPATDDTMNANWDGKITVQTSHIDHIPTPYEECVSEYGEDSVQCTIIAEAETDASLCPTVNDDGTVNITSAESTNALVCSAPDDYGTSYYYRGVPENNWVKFGGYYWRILRVNGDNSIRMIYAGDASVIDALDDSTKAQVLSNGYNDSSTLYTQIGKSEYNYYWKKDNVQETTNAYVYNDNAGVGYMYGNRDGVTEGTTEYSTSSWTSTNTYYVSEEYSYDVTTDRFTLKNPIAVLASEMTSDYIGYYTHSETSSSSSYAYIHKITSVSVGESSTTVGYSYVRYGTTSKEQAQTNTNTSDIKEYIDNWYATNLAGYETYISDTLFCNDRTIQETIPSGYSNLGYGVELTAYRWYSKSNGIKLTCQEQNDRFTVDDEVIGNGDLTYPIGLLTKDEAFLAGGYSSLNSAYYLYTGNWYWTMSPSDFRGATFVGGVGSNGYADGSNDVRNSGGGVRPTINLKPNVLNSGTGLASDPYKIVE